MTVHVQTVAGPVPVETLGATVTHEHVFLDSRDGFVEQAEVIAPDLKVTPDTRAEVDRHPLAVLDNLLLDDFAVALEELRSARDHGLGCLVEATSLYTGRHPERLAQVARKSGLHIVMGSGFYLERAIPQAVRALSEDDMYTILDADLREGVETAEGSIRPGVMGEVGVSTRPTEVEQRSLRAAARAAYTHGVPLSIHLPAWEAIGGDVLDIVEDAVPSLRGVLLGHLNPMAHDLDYLSGLARRGAWLGLDMLGNSLDYGGGRKSPDLTTNLDNTAALISAGLGERILFSSDVGQKNMLYCNGGQGYGYVLRHFMHKLAARDVDPSFSQNACILNPRLWFKEAAGAC